MCSALALFLLAAGTAGAFPRPAPYSDTSSPTSTIVSYYNALNRGEYARATGYLRTPPHVLTHHVVPSPGDVVYTQLNSLKLLGYTDVSSFHVAMCVATRLTTYERQGLRTRYRGWFIVENTTGQEPSFGGWRIDMTASHLFPYRKGIGSLHQQRCRIV